MPLHVEHHLVGKIRDVHEKRGYCEKRVRYKSDVEFCSKLSYNSKTGEVTLEQCMFGFHLMSLATDYYGKEEYGTKLLRHSATIPEYDGRCEKPSCRTLRPAIRRLLSRKEPSTGKDQTVTRHMNGILECTCPSEKKSEMLQQRTEGRNLTFH